MTYYVNPASLTEWSKEAHHAGKVAVKDPMFLDAREVLAAAELWLKTEHDLEELPVELSSTQMLSLMMAFAAGFGFECGVRRMLR